LTIAQICFRRTFHFHPSENTGQGVGREALGFFPSVDLPSFFRLQAVVGPCHFAGKTNPPPQKRFPLGFVPTLSIFSPLPGHLPQNGFAKGLRVAPPSPFFFGAQPGTRVCFFLGCAHPSKIPSARFFLFFFFLLGGFSVPPYSFLAFLPLFGFSRLPGR